MPSNADKRSQIEKLRMIKCSFFVHFIVPLNVCHIIVLLNDKALNYIYLI